MKIGSWTKGVIIGEGRLIHVFLPGFFLLINGSGVRVSIGHRRMQVRWK